MARAGRWYLPILVHTTPPCPNLPCRIRRGRGCGCRGPGMYIQCPRAVRGISLRALNYRIAQKRECSVTNGLQCHRNPPSTLRLTASTWGSNARAELAAKSRRRVAGIDVENVTPPTPFSSVRRFIREWLGIGEIPFRAYHSTPKKRMILVMNESFCAAKTRIPEALEGLSGIGDGLDFGIAGGGRLRS